MTTRSTARLQRCLLALATSIAFVALVAGCAAHTVRAYQRERVVDRIMSFRTEAKKDARMTKSLEAREGSTGGNGGAGGGCACN